MRILGPRSSRTATNHEALFIERYERLLGLALQLTEGDRERAEDLVHDAFIQFSFSQPDLNAIENLEGYLYGMLRKLHLSQMRRDSRSRIQPHFLVEYDSAETGLHLIDPRDRLQAQEELRRVCHYACTRKETSKAGSVLILRFFHGYYPSEITKIIRGTRHAVDLRLRSARVEAKATLANPEMLVFMNEKPAPDIREKVIAQSTVEFLAELRRTIFRSRHGDCLSSEQFDSTYGPHSEALITCETLAHIVSCQSCLDRVNRLYGLPLLSERYAVDTMGKDDSSKGGGPGDGTGSGGGDKGVARCRRRAREVFEHRPQELHISVNGFIQGSQKVNSEQSEQTLDIDMAEQIGFVEVFSEQETRLLFLDVEPPPSGSVEQRTRVELSNERTLELTLSFRGPWPTLHTVYNDPVFKAERESESDLAEKSDAEKRRCGDAEIVSDPARSPRLNFSASPRLLHWLRFVGDRNFWLRPGVVTAIVVLILTVAVLSLYRRVQPPALTAANLLQQSTQAEETFASRPDTVLHRTLQFEERSSSGDLLARSRVEVWQSTERGVVARRLYNEKNALVAGDWRRSDGVQILYQHGVRPQLQLAPEKRGLAGTISFADGWQQSVSAKDFASLIGDAGRALVEESADAYVIRYATPGGANTHGLGRAALVIRRHDLHAIEQTLTISDGKEQREYRLTETSFERRAASVVEPSVFEPEPELLKNDGVTGRRGETEKVPPSAHLPVFPSSVVATAELEVEVLRLIHQAKADMGEQVSVTRGSDGILRIEGIFDTDQRKSEVLRELQPVMNNPALRVDVQTVAEALQRQSQPRQSAGQITVQPPESTANAVPVEDELRRYFAAKGFKDKQIDDEIRRFSNRMLDQSREAMAHAWALKRLANRFSSQQIAALDRETRNKWLSIIGEHAQALLQETSSVRRELQDIFPNSITDGATEEIEVINDRDLVRASERLFDLSSQYTQVVRAAFIISSENTNAQVIRTAQFWRSLERAESLAARIQKAVSSKQ